jgi:hypothetical protein
MLTTLLAAWNHLNGDSKGGEHRPLVHCTQRRGQYPAREAASFIVK